MDKPKTTLSNGDAVVPGYDELKPNGQQKDYIVLSVEERSKGFVRPYRTTYVHTKLKPQFPLQDLTEEQEKRFGSQYIKYEPFPESMRPSVGRFWSKEDLTPCGAQTTMSRSISETYARDPSFYGSTFCCACGKHYPVEQFVWLGTNEKVGS